MSLKDEMLGKKIKSLRLQKNMTQAALAGDTITRNMLSQIENGVALPSVSTIIELAKKLDTPIEYFFSENGELGDFKKLGAIAKIRKLYTLGDYAKCISRLEALGVSDDETEFIYAKSFFACGKGSFQKGEKQSADIFFELALKHGAKSVYIDAEFFEKAKSYLNTLSEESKGES